MEHNGNVITARGPVDPKNLGSILMHEHLHCDIFNWKTEELLTEEKPMTEERHNFMMKEAVPYLGKCTEQGCCGFLDATPSPWRAWPDFYKEASDASGMHMILCTGFYRDVEMGTYWVKKKEDSIWPFVKQAPIEELADFCIKEIQEGMHGTDIHAGAIKLGTSQPEMTEAEEKALRAGARAQKATGVHITTHCTQLGAETTQLSLFEEEGVDLSRVVIGHTAQHLMDKEHRKVCMDWMRRGANFLPTNMGITDDPNKWEPLIHAIHEVFDAGLGEKIAGFSLDWAFVSESAPFGPCSFIPPPPFLHMFTHTLPSFRKMGLTEAEEKAIMVTNPQKVLPVKSS